MFMPYFDLKFGWNQASDHNVFADTTVVCTMKSSADMTVFQGYVMSVYTYECPVSM